MDLVLGVDGGNTKAIALIATVDGSIVGAARRSGSADIYAGEADALDLLRSVVADALADAGATRSAVATTVFSLAGADWPEDIADLAAALSEGAPGSPPLVVNDAVGALAGAVPDGPAVVVSLGTGAATGARGADGRTWHSSFWQVTQGAAQLAQGALDAVTRSGLGIRPAPVLVDRLLAATGDATVEAALHRLTSRGHRRASSVGSLVRALLDAADAGDEAAAAIVVDHGRQLGEVAAAAARQVGIDAGPYDLAFCGGLGRTRPLRLLDPAVAAIRDSGQAPRPVPPRWEPAVGALVIGLRATAPEQWPAVAARLDATISRATVFDRSS